MNQLNRESNYISAKTQGPRIITLPKIGDDSIGFLTFAENKTLIPFDVKRVYWVYSTPEFIERGNHGHLETEQICVAIKGKIGFDLEDLNGCRTNFLLSSPHQGLFIPKAYWRKILYSENAVLLVLASTLYSVSDYIREYSEWIHLQHLSSAA